MLIAAVGCRPGEGLLAPADLASPPTGFSAAPVSVRSIRLSWQALPGSTVIGYRVERRVNLAGAFTVLQALVPQAPGQAMAYFDTDLEPETFYGYRLIAIDRLSNESPPSTVAGAKTPSLPGIEVHTVARTDPAFDDQNGYSVTILGPDTVRSTVGSRVTRRFNPLEAGVYQVTLGDVAAPCELLTAATQQVTVTDQGIATITPVEFEAFCRDATRGRIFAGVAVTGEIPSGGEFVVDVTGIASEQGLPDSLRAFARTLRFGTSDLRELANLRAGTYQADLTSLPQGCLRDGPQRREVSVAPLSVDTVRFELRCGSAANDPPVARANGPYTGLIGVPIDFTSAGSSDPDGTIASYAWDFGDGTTGTGASPSKAYATVGTYTVTLTVTDDKGASATAQAQVTVTSGGTGGPPPTWRAEFGPVDQSTGRVTLRITLDLTADLAATPGPEALASWAVQSLRWNPAVLQYFSFNFGSGATGSVNTSGQATGELSFNGNLPSSGSSGFLTIARIQFTVVGSAGASTTTETILGAILGTAATGGFNYKPFLEIAEGQFVVPGGGGGGTGTVAGTVTRSSGGPIAGATVTVAPGGSATTNGSGQYSVASVAVGSGTVTVSNLPAGCTAPAAKNYSIAAANQTAVVDFVVTCDGGGGATGTVSGKVTRATGEAISSATVTAVPGGSATTTATGQYSLANVPVGTGTVTVTNLPAGCTAPAAKNYSITAAGQVATVDFTVSCGGTGGAGTVTGVVTRSSGGAIAGATVTVAPGGSATTSPAGQYTVSNVPVGSGTVTLSNLPAGCTVPAAKNYTVASGETVTVNFSVTCAAAGNAVNGTWTVSGTTATLELRATVVTGNLGTVEGNLNVNSSRLEYLRVEAAAAPNLSNVFGGPPPLTVVNFGAFTTTPGGLTGDAGIIKIVFNIKPGAGTTVNSTLTGMSMLNIAFGDITSSFGGRFTVAPLSLP
jgi:PKD repeat protein